MIGLDANAVIACINQRTPHVRRRPVEALASDAEVGVPAIVVYEISYGISKSARVAENRAALEEFLSLDVQIWSFDRDDAIEAGDIRASLERTGTIIGAYDILIAAQARRRDALLVTGNMREFARVPGLRCEDWSA